MLLDVVFFSHSKQSPSYYLAYSCGLWFQFNVQSLCGSMLTPTKGRLVLPGPPLSLLMLPEGRRVSSGLAASVSQWGGPSQACSPVGKGAQPMADRCWRGPGWAPLPQVLGSPGVVRGTPV